MVKRAESKDGFTIIEVVIAMGIFALVIAGGMIGVRRGFEVVENSRHYTRVSQILQSEVESMRSLSWAEVDALPANSTITIDPEFDTGTYDMYTVTRVITPVSGTSGDVKQVDVTATFTNRQGRTISMNYVTFFADGGVNDYYYRTI